MKKKSNAGPTIRWMIRGDMKEVLAIEKESFEHFWDEEEFIRCLRQRNCIGMVCEGNDTILGYMIYEIHKNRIHLLNFAVDQKYRRNGYGSAMIQKLVGKLSYQRRSRITLEVRESNLPALNFFKSQGFRAVDIIKDFYEETTDDAIVMSYRVNQESECSV
jgi:[ribosomal protein S18]-alanine N-acetyltransferase